MYTLKTIPLNPEGGNLSAVRGAVLTFKADPFLNNEDECYDYVDDALVVIQDGHIVAAGPYRDVYAAYGSRIDAGSIDHYENSLILPGFIDCHHTLCADTHDRLVRRHSAQLAQRVYFPDRKPVQRQKVRR